MMRVTAWLLVVVLFVTLTGCGGGQGTNVAKTTVDDAQVKALQDQTNEMAKAGEASLDPALRAQLDENRKRAEHTQALVAEAEKHLVRNADGTISLDSSATRSGSELSPEARQFAEDALVKTNAMIKAGKAVAGTDFSIHSTDPATRANENSFRWMWYGFRLGLNSSRASTLAFCLKYGASCTWIAGYLPGGAIVGAVMAIIFTIGWFAISMCNVSGRGVFIYSGCYVTSQ